jgi:hypothetical protein
MKSRPIIPNAAILNTTKQLEKFQNLTLRPIIKSLNGLLLLYFQNYTTLKRFDIANATALEKNKFVTIAFLKDNQFKNELKGIVIGHFTIEEYCFYKNSSKQINKRIFGIFKQRILSF